MREIRNLANSGDWNGNNWDQGDLDSNPWDLFVNNKDDTLVYMTNDLKEHDDTSDTNFQDLANCLFPLPANKASWGSAEMHALSWDSAYNTRGGTTSEHKMYFSLDDGY